MKTKKLAPIIVFAFNRVDTLQNTIESLKKNKEAKDSELFLSESLKALCAATSMSTRKYTLKDSGTAYHPSLASIIKLS
jgi:hypothetical protein